MILKRISLPVTWTPWIAQVGWDPLRSAKGHTVLCHGGPFDEPQNVAEALARLPGVQGFFGACEHRAAPTERAIRGQVSGIQEAGSLAPVPQA